MMKSKSKAISVLVAACLAVNVFSFAPAAFAREADEQAGTKALQSSQQEVASDQTEQTEERDETDGVKEPEGSKEPPGTEGSAEEKHLEYQITVIQPEAGGTIQTDKTKAAENETVTYTAVPAEGYKITSIQIGEKMLEAEKPYETATGTFSPEGDTQVTAVFEKLKTYRIATSVNSSSKGSITASASVLENEEMTIKAKAKSGYYLSDLLVDGESVGAPYTYTFSNVTEAHTVKAVFSKQVKIMLDAGHFGNYNRSPVYSAYYESRMTWSLHNHLKTALEDYNGFSVGVTRASQAKDMNVYTRGTVSKGYDLFLSLHSNSSSARSTDYPLIITQKGKTGDSLAKSLGKTIQDTMGTKQGYKVWQRLNSDGKTEYYGVLRGSKAVGTKGMIIEHSFHTNLVATKWLFNNSNLKKMAQKEAQVLAEHYGLSKAEDNGKDDADTIEVSTPAVNKVTAATKPASSKTVKSSQKVKVIITGLNMRKSYTTSSKSMGKAKKNKTYQLKAKTKDGKWGQLKTNGYWIYLKGYTKAA
ncbi:MAG: N-acetylmuramoyl-L-alanine amidase [Firmicutes bacterium]|nr:N-acetylmuramoyl-L-alanine amidase [Bacillota bacterium]